MVLVKFNIMKGPVKNFILLIIFNFIRKFGQNCTVIFFLIQRCQINLNFRNKK